MKIKTKKEGFASTQLLKFSENITLMLISKNPKIKFSRINNIYKLRTNSGYNIIIR